ncbi:MAG: GNAT family protein [Bacteroidota bacterium]|nr:GNAT family protein [Bacteroidota bacterium]
MSQLLKGEHVFLRPLEPGDIDFIHFIENDTEVWKVSDTLIPYSRYQVEQYVLNTQHDIFSEKQIRFVIEKEDVSSSLIGAIDLYDFDPIHRRAGIGVMIISAEREKGYAGEALSLLITYAFKVLQLHQVFSYISALNTPSIHLFETAGFEKCGERKEWRLENGHWRDEWMYQLIRKENL